MILKLIIIIKIFKNNGVIIRKRAQPTDRDHYVPSSLIIIICIFITISYLLLGYNITFTVYK